MRDSTTKIAIFIDGTNFSLACKVLGLEIDYKMLLKEFQNRGMLLRAFYYTAILEDEQRQTLRPFTDWLDYNGYTVVTKPAKEFIDARGVRKIKGNMDIEIAVDAMELAGRIDEIVLCSGDGDFRPLIRAMQRRGVRVVVVSTVATQPPIVADELRRQADEFIDLVELRAKITKTASAERVTAKTRLASSRRLRDFHPVTSSSQEEQQ